MGQITAGMFQIGHLENLLYSKESTRVNGLGKLWSCHHRESRVGKHMSEWHRYSQLWLENLDLSVWRRLKLFEPGFHNTKEIGSIC